MDRRTNGNDSLKGTHPVSSYSNTHWIYDPYPEILTQMAYGRTEFWGLPI